jgi:hypothetical protein
MNTTTISPAVWYARIFGIVLTILGVVGLFLTTSQNNVEQVVGMDVNLMHNLVHLATGVLGLVVGYSMLHMARTYAIGLGLVYAVLGIWGLIEGATFDPLGLFGNINTMDTIVHLAIGVVGIAAWAMSNTDTEGEPVA